MKWKRNDGCLTDEILQYYIDGELDEGKTDEVNIHLAECRNCKSRLQEKKNVIEDLKSGLSAIGENEAEIPVFRLSDFDNNTEQARTKRVYFQWAAAAVSFILISFYTVKEITRPAQKETTYILYDLSTETDANKPWHDQPMTMYIMDDSGKMLEEINL